MNFYSKLFTQMSTESINTLDNKYSTEARNILKDSQLRINSKSEALYTNSITENMILFSLTTNQQDSLELFNRLKLRKGGLIVSKLKNFYAPRNLILKLPGRSIIKMFKKNDIIEKAKPYGISTILNTPSLLTNFSTMYDFSLELESIKVATVGKAPNSLNPKMRDEIRKFIKNRIVNFPDNEKVTYANKVVIIPGPFFKGTNIRLTMMNKDLLNRFSPFLLIMEWIYNDIEDFEKFMKEHNVSFMFKSEDNKTLFLTPNDKVLKLKTFNKVFIMKILHILDKSTDPELISLSDEDKKTINEVVDYDEEGKENVTDGTTPDSINPIEIPPEMYNDNSIREDGEENINVIFNEDDSEEQTEELFDDLDQVTEEEIINDSKELDTNEDGISTTDVRDIVSTTESNILDIEEMTADNLGVDYVIKRNSKHEYKSLQDILEAGDLSEEEKVDKILEVHNYSSLSRSLETDSVKKLKKKLNSKYGRKVADVVEDIKRHKIPTTTFKNVEPSHFSKNSFVNLENTYNSVVGKTDFEGIITSPMESSYPMFLTKYEETPNISREFNGKTIKLTYEDTGGTSHDIVLDYPVSINGKLFIGGSFKQLNLQDAAKPVIKTDEDVIITTSYNKMFLKLMGTYASKGDKQLVLTIDEYLKNGGIGFVSKTTTDLGDFIYKNLVSYELIHLNRYYNKFLCRDVHIDFRGIKDIESEGQTKTILGYIKDNPVMHNPESNTYVLPVLNKDGKVESKHIDNLPEFITRMAFEALKIQEQTEEVKKSIALLFKCFANITTRKVSNAKINSVYAKVMARDIPVIFLMLIAEPLNNVLERLKTDNNLEYKIVKSNEEKISRLERLEGTATLKFANDIYLIVKYNNKVNEIILAPLMNLDMGDVEVFNINTIINDVMGSATTIIYIENFVDYFLNDPSIKRVLRMYNMPEDFVGLLIYACSLFTTNRTTYKSDASNYRVITTSEVINRCLYDVLSKTMSDNAARVKMGSRSRITDIPRDALIRRLQQLPNMSEYSTLNPFRTIMDGRKKSLKGHLGTNQARAFSTTLRMYNDNNIGTETAATPYSGEAGVTKVLPMSPTIDSVTGEYKHLDAKDGYSDPSKVLSFIESYVPYLYYDHIIRGMMADNQFSHAMPPKNADPMYVSYGADEAALYQCPGFSYVAKGNGVVLSTNETYTKIKYDNGEIDIIPMNEDERNADKGYFVPNKMQLSDKLAVGKKFKEGDAICYNKLFFKKKSNNRIGLGAGPVVMVVICDGEGTWEDSCIPFDSTSDKLSSPITKRVARVLDLNTEIRDYNTDLYSTVNADDILYKFRVLEEDDFISSYFEMDDNLSMTDVTAHNHGILKDIRIYYRNGRDVNMSESIKNFIKEVRLKQRQLNHTDELEDVTDEFRKIKYGKEPMEVKDKSFSKINGDVIENGQILIEYYIESEFKLGSGDKLVVDRALKGEPCDVYPDELAPVGALTGKRGGILFNTYGLLARITPGMVLHGSLITILQHIAIKNRMILNRPPEPGSMLDYKSSHSMLEGKYKYK